MNKTTLKFELDLSFVLIAITAQLKDYTFCFKINKGLGTDFTKLPDLELTLNSGEEHSYFSFFEYILPESESECYIIANKGTEGFLVPEMAKVDYFLLIKNYIDSDDLKQLISGINKIPEVLVVLEVDPKKLKSKENLIF